MRDDEHGHFDSGVLQELEVAVALFAYFFFDKKKYVEQSTESEYRKDYIDGCVACYYSTMTPLAKKMLLIIYAVFVILSPSLLFRYLVNSDSPDEQAGVLASGLFAYLIGIPLIAISGLVTALVVRNRRSSRAYLKIMLGFAIPATIVLTIIAL